MLASTLLNNQWFADIATGLIVVIIVGIPTFARRWLKAQLKELMNEIRPNGGHSLSSGDTVGRIETKLDAMIVTVAAQKGHTDTVEALTAKRLTNLETRAQVAQRIEDDNQ